MKGKAFIDWLRGTGTVSMTEIPGTALLLADAVEEADDAAQQLVSCEAMGERIDSVRWMNTSWGVSPRHLEVVTRALSYLDRRGLIERKPGSPHLIRFVEE